MTTQISPSTIKRWKRDALEEGFNVRESKTNNAKTIKRLANQVAMLCNMVDLSFQENWKRPDKLLTNCQNQGPEE